MYDAPSNRRGKHDGTHEEHFPEASVMLAFAMHLIESGARTIEIHPDGEHAKRYDIRGWLLSENFKSDAVNGAGCVGTYTRDDCLIDVTMRPGNGDVVAMAQKLQVVAECKGGIINTKHSGAVSRLRKGLCEAVGQLLGRQLRDGERHIAVVPYTPTTAALADRMASRCLYAGIEIALVMRDGAVIYATQSYSANLYRRDVP